MSPSPRFAVLGNPISHSLSPSLHRAAFEATDLIATYDPIQVIGPELGSVMGELTGSGGGGNVTLPHKESAAALLTRASSAVEATGACNTFWGEGDDLVGDNTDVVGFNRAVEGFLGQDLKGAKVGVLGSGGAARAVLHALLEQGPDRVWIWNRTPARLATLMEAFSHPSIKPVTTLEDGFPERPDLLVNATSLGLSPDDPLPISLERVRPHAVFDLVYGKPTTAFVVSASQQGIPATDGKTMLVHQAAAAFERWFEREAPLEAMMAALPRFPETD